MAINNEPDIHKLVMCANVFIKRGDKYLVLRRSPLKRWATGVVHPIGGKIDLDEDPVAAAKREALEEAGITLRDLRLEAVISEINPVKAEPGNWLIFHFSGKYESGEVKQTEEGELIWLTEEQIKQEQLFPSVRAIVEQLFNRERGVIFARFEYKSDRELDEARASVQVLGKGTL